MIISALKACWREEDGQDLVEYALLLAFIALAAVAVLSTMSSNISALWNAISTSLQNAVTTAQSGSGS